MRHPAVAVIAGASKQVFKQKPREKLRKRVS
jgi:hypothetical protein